MQGLWRLFWGYVIIKVKGPGLERFINRAANAGIALWDTERLSTGMLVARVSIPGFRKVRQVCRAQGWKVALAQKAGLPFLLAALLRRKALVAGALASVAALYAASSFIWFVHVDAPPGLPVEEILAVAASQGLRPGVHRGEVDRDAVQTALLLQVDELVWAAVNVQGTRAVIHAAERVGVDPAAARPGDVVAERDGIVHDIVVFEGNPVVEKGDTVKAGDVLISGFIAPGLEEHKRLLDEGKAPYVRADGLVRARVWYEGRAIAHLQVTEEKPTGERAAVWELRFGEKTWRIGRRPEYRWARETERTWGVTVGPVKAGVRRVVFDEVLRNVTAVPEEEARLKAIEAARAQLEATVPEDAVVIGSPEYDVRLVEREGFPVVEATARVEVIEEIAGFRKIEF